MRVWFCINVINYPGPKHGEKQTSRLRVTDSLVHCETQPNGFLNVQSVLLRREQGVNKQC